MIDTNKLWSECQPCVAESGYRIDHFKRCISGIRNTLPKILVENCKSHPSASCMRKKDLGIWNSYTWAQVYEKVRHLALGLKSLGIEKTDKVSVIGDNDPEWYWAEMAIQSVGGTCVGLYIDAMPADIEYIINNSDTVIVFAKDQEQVDKFIEIKEEIQKVRKLIYWDVKGMGSYRENNWLMEFSDLLELGRAYDKKHPNAFVESAEKGSERDPAFICYTSGTTSLPKGAILSHEYLIKMGIRVGAAIVPQKDDNLLSFIPPAWIVEQLMIANWAIFKLRVNFPEEPETVTKNLREIGVQVAILGPMQWQGILSQVQMKIFDTGILRKWIYDISLSIGYKFASVKELHGGSASLFWKLLYMVSNILCLYHIRDYLGFSRLRYGLTGGSALGPDVIRWFSAIGVKIKDAYGLTELDPASFHRELVKPGTSGPPAPGVEIRISAEGEVYLHSDVMFQGYYNNLEATNAILTGDGWLRTGDCGALDGDGHLVIYDRLKEMLRLEGGGLYSPSYIQNRLKFSPYIKETLVIGGELRNFIFAIITIDFDNVGKWAEKNRISYTTFVDLSQKDEVYDLIEKEVKRVNKTLPTNVNIGRYALLHKEFDPDESELTRSRKLRRDFLEKRYALLIEGAYRGQDSITVEADVKYRDGRVGKMKTNLKIRTLNLGAEG